MTDIDRVGQGPGDGTGTPDVVVTLSARMLFIVGDRVLLANRRGENWFFLPGGNVEPGETVETALHRELREETGLAARSLDFLGCVEHSYVDAGAPFYELNVIFSATLPHGVDIVSREEAVDINSVAIRDLYALDFRPKALATVLRSWLDHHRPVFWTSTT